MVPIDSDYRRSLNLYRCRVNHYSIRILQNQVRRLVYVGCSHVADNLRRKAAIIESVALDTPPWERETTGMWLDVPKPTLQLLESHAINPAEAIHAASHAFLNQFALAKDLGTECKVAEKEYKATESKRKRPARSVLPFGCKKCHHI